MKALTEWSSTEIKLLARMRERGMYARDIAKLLGRTKSAVDNKAHAEQFKRTPIDQVVSNENKPWELLDDALLREAHSVGFSDRVIAKALGRSIGAVGSRKTHLKLIPAKAEQIPSKKVIETPVETLVGMPLKMPLEIPKPVQNYKPNNTELDMYDRIANSVKAQPDTEIKVSRPSVEPFGVITEYPGFFKRIIGTMIGVKWRF